MAGSATEIKFSLKILIDVKSKKVVFAEAGKDFVDFIFSIMSLPLSTITKLLNEKLGMVGCLGALYKSIESLGVEYYEPILNKDSVLKPRNTAVIVPLLSLIDAPKKITYYRSYGFPNYVTDCRGILNYGRLMTREVSFDYVAPKTLGEYKPAGFVKGAVRYMVMDNLEVKPMSITLIKSLVHDFDSIEEKQVEFGLQEGLALLKASMEKQTVLTSVFLKRRNNQ